MVTLSPCTWHEDTDLLGRTRSLALGTGANRSSGALGTRQRSRPAPTPSRPGSLIPSSRGHLSLPTLGQNCVLWALWLPCVPITSRGKWLWFFQETILQALWCLGFSACLPLKILFSGCSADALISLSPLIWNQQWPEGEVVCLTRGPPAYVQALGVTDVLQQER